MVDYAAAVDRGARSSGARSITAGHGQLLQPHLNFVRVKHRQQFVGQLHSEHRIWQQLLMQQYQDPPVEHPEGQPPPTSQDGHAEPIVSHCCHGELHAPPMQVPQPAQGKTEANASLLPVRRTAVDNAVPPINLNNPRRDDRRASHPALRSARSAIQSYPFPGPAADSRCGSARS